MYALALDFGGLNLFKFAGCSIHCDIQNQKENWVYFNELSVSHRNGDWVCNFIRSEYFFLAHQDV
jgi:hypothetical protein